MGPGSGFGSVVVRGSAGRAPAGVGRFVGRVGALAVALGIGAAVASAPGALADTTGAGGTAGASDPASATDASPTAATRPDRGGPARGRTADTTSRSRATSPVSAAESADPGPSPVSGSESARALTPPAPAASGRAGDSAPAVPGVRHDGALAGRTPAGEAPDPETSRRFAGPAFSAADDPAPAADVADPAPSTTGLAEPTVSASPTASAPVMTRGESEALATAARRSGLGALITDGGSGGPATAPLAWAALAAARRELGGSTPDTMPVAYLVERLDAQAQAVVRTVFHSLVNWTSTLPVNPLTTALETGLLTVRKSLFNQTPRATSIQTANSPELVAGKIDIVDPDGDGWNVELVGNPAFGSVVLGKDSQANGIGAITYRYTPADGYTGSDQFIVEITPKTPVVNVLHPFGVLNTRYYTVSVGDAADAAKECFSCSGSDLKDTPDTHLYISNAAATVTIEKQGFLTPRYTAEVTLSAQTADKSFRWMDTRGNMGSIAVQRMLVDDWSAYDRKAAGNGVKPLLMLRYSDQGTEKAIFVDVSSVTRNADGTFTLSGRLTANSPAQDGRVDSWDFIGDEYKAAFEDFINGARLSECAPGRDCASVSAVGTLAFTTLSPSAFIETGEPGYPAPGPDVASATQTSPGSMGPGTTDFGEGNGTESFGSTDQQPIELTAMIPWGTGGSFISASNLTQGNAEGSPNGIFLHTASVPAGGGNPTWTKTQLVDNQWNAAVNAMAAYDQVLTNPDGDPVPTTLAGTVSGTKNLTLAVPVGINPASLIGQPITGQGIPPNTIINGFVSAGTVSLTYVSPGVGGTTYSVNNAISAASGAISVTLPDIPTLQPGLVVGLSDGSVYYWNGHACTRPSCAAPTVDYANPAVIQTGADPVSVAIASNGNVYAAGSALVVIDSTNYEVITTITAPWTDGSFPSVAVNPNGLFAYATGAFSSGMGVAVIDTTKNTVTTTIQLAGNATANAVAISPDGDLGYIVNAAANGGTPSVIQFDTNSNTITGSAALPDGNYGRAGTAFSADGAYLYVSNAGSGDGTAGTIVVIDTASNAVVTQIDVAMSPGAMALSPDGQSLLVTQVPNVSANGVAVIDTATNELSNAFLAGNSLGAGPAGVVFNPFATVSRAYVTNSNESTMSIIDTKTWSVIDTIPTGYGQDDTLGVAITPDGLSVYLANYSGGSSGTVPVFQVATAVPKEWVQLQAANGWGAGVAVNTVTALRDNSGFAVGLSNGQIGVWSNPIETDGTVVPGPGAGSGCSNGNNDSCWFMVGGTVAGATVNAMIPSGPGLVAVGNGPGGGGSVTQTWDGLYTNTGEAPTGSAGGPNPTTLLPYDGTTLVGAIGGTPVVADITGSAPTGVISAPSYAAQLVKSAAYSAATAGCSLASSYGSGSGVGCSGYVLTVQQVAGNPIRVGQTLYGGAGLLPGTVITQQISDGSGNLCALQCDTGGAGVYLVDTSQLVAPGTPMSASDGTGYIVGNNDGTVDQVGYGFVDNGRLNTNVNWNSAVNTMIPWRDGLLVGLNNGAVFYWSPSNNPGGNNPDNANALDYAGSTIANQTGGPGQPPGWSQLRGYVDSCGCVQFGSAVTSMVPMGDGFAVGLAATDSSSNGAVWGFNGFGAVSPTAAFGYQQSAGTNPVVLAAVDDFAQMAANNVLGTGPNASIQQLIPVPQLDIDASGNPVLATSVLAGLTNNGIYDWTGTNQWTASAGATGEWKPLQLSGDTSLDEKILKDAWEYAKKATNTWLGTGVGGTKDPLFTLTENLPPDCGTSCQGTYVPIVYHKPLGTDGVIYTIGDDPGIQANLNLSLLGYGYVFIPKGFVDKFEADDYSASLLFAVQGGPSVVLKPPANGGYIKDTVKITGPSWSDTQETEIGVFAETVGINASVTGKIGLNTKPLPDLTLAYAYYTPGLLVSWNTSNSPGQMSVNYSAFPSKGYVTQAQINEYLDPSKADASLSATATPYAQLSYGLFTPASYPVSLDIFSLSVGYENPVTATLNIPLNDLPDSLENTTLSLASQGILTVSAGFLPKVTSLLTWKDKYKVYSVKEEFKVFSS